jgi:non-specific serine/threonine protein kinase
MLETIREYALERLDASEELAAVRRRHVEYFLVLAEVAEPRFRGPEEVTWLDRLDREHDNLRTALNWAVESDLNDHALRLAGALRELWLWRGYLTEGRERMARLLARTASERSAARAKVLYGAGVLARNQGDYSAGRSFGEEGLGIARELREPGRIAMLLNSLGATVRHQGDYDLARSLIRESLAIRRQREDLPGIAASLHNLGLVERAQGDNVSARPLLEESLAIWRALGHRQGIAQPLRELGRLALSEGDYVRAQQQFEQSLTLDREVSNLIGCSHALIELGRLAQARGAWERAARLFGAAEGMRDLLRAPVHPVERPRYDQSVAALLPELGEESFSAAWAEGRLMTMEQAVAYALAWPPSAG